MSADPLWDHLVRAQQQRLRDLDPERLSGLEVDHEVVPSWLLHRKLARLRPLEDLVDVDGRTPETAIREAVGTASLRSSSRFALSAVALSVTPVTFPPGLARLATKPTPSGSPERAMTIGMTALASLAAAAAGEPKVMIKSTLRATSSAANAGSSSRLASAQRPS